MHKDARCKWVTSNGALILAYKFIKAYIRIYLSIYLYIYMCVLIYVYVIIYIYIYNYIILYIYISSGPTSELYSQQPLLLLGIFCDRSEARCCPIFLRCFLILSITSSTLLAWDLQQNQQSHSDWIKTMAREGRSYQPIIKTRQNTVKGDVRFQMRWIMCWTITHNTRKTGRQIRRRGLTLTFDSWEWMIYHEMQQMQANGWNGLLKYQIEKDRVSHWS